MGKADRAAQEISIKELKQEVLNDYRLAVLSREASLMGRREVLTGKAKFGIFGDGKEVAQIAMAKQVQNGDWRSGYYRDQTYMLATDSVTLQQFFAQLYAHPDLAHDPHSGGRQMNAHFATRILDHNGEWEDQMQMKNTSADMSPTAGQMPRMLGLAYASTFYRNSEKLQEQNNKFTKKGNEVTFGTIGDASTSEGLFWETINAAGVLQVPLVLAVWDDGYGISVPQKYQTTKESISEVLAGFQRTEEKVGWEIVKVKGWDYAKLCLAFEKAANIARTEHVPVLVHVVEITQPQGHSTSGSHERYKTPERLTWEREHDCLVQMRSWVLDNKIAKEKELIQIEKEAVVEVREAKKAAWTAYREAVNKEKQEVLQHLKPLESIEAVKIQVASLEQNTGAYFEDLAKAARKTLWALAGDSSKTEGLKKWYKQFQSVNENRFSSDLYSESAHSPLYVKQVQPIYENTKMVDGREVLLANFDAILAKHEQVLFFGEDAGKIGGVNQTLAGMQEKYGEHRVFDTGIREATIVGQAIGLALRGFRPIAEIQYLDYILYALQTLSDDLSSLRYRTKGGQTAPLIISTRGHRLEGIWHSGSPLGTIINSFRGMYVCVPRNMTKAAGFYNTLLEGDDPGLVIESLNGYRIKEQLPVNHGDYKEPLGVPEVLIEGEDLTLVTYGSLVRIAEKACSELQEHGISVELIDVQTLLPFDTERIICTSIEKTNKVIFLDEDVPGGATAYMMQQVLETQEGYAFLDAQPKTLTAKAHRPPYGSDGDYFTKPSVEDVFEAVYETMSVYNPGHYPAIV